MFYLVDAPHRRVALANLSQCFPARAEAERRAIARRMFQHFGVLLVELLRFSGLSAEAMRRAVEVDGEERVRAAYAKGRGVLFFTGHFGFWELHAIVHALLFEPIGVLARPLDNPGLHELLEALRQRTGNSVIYREGAVRRVLRTLADGHGVALLIDQHMHSPDAIWVRFFQRPAATTSTLAALALRTGAPVVPVFTVPLPNGRFRLIYERPVEPPAPAPPTRCATSLSGAPTCSRCTCVVSPSCGCGCTAGGATRRRRKRAGCSRSCATTEPAMAEPPRRVVVAAPNWLGDAVMGLPAVRAVRAHAPAAHLAVAARPSVAALYAMVPEVDAVIPLSPPAPLWRTAAWRQDAARLAAERFELACSCPIRSWQRGRRPGPPSPSAGAMRPADAAAS